MASKKFNNSDGKTQSDLYDRIVKNTGLFGGVQGLVVLIGIVRTKIVSVLLGPVGFGINESFNRTVNLVRSTTDLGLPFSSVRNVSECMEKPQREGIENSILVARSWVFLTAALGLVLSASLSYLFSMWAFDGDRAYTLSFLLLSPAVAAGILNGGEMAILKGSRMIHQLALGQLATAALTIVVSVPLYSKFGLGGLVPSIDMMSILSLAVTGYFSCRAFPYRIRPFSVPVLRQGGGMLKLGIFYTITAFFGSAAFSIIANWLMKHGDAAVTGIYSAGYLMVSYLGLFVFSAMETDYFPRLSSVHSDREKSTDIVNRQSEVAVVLMSPMIIAFIVFSTWIINVFLSDQFSAAVPMSQFAVVSLLFSAMTKPVEYLSLAKGDSRTYMFQEIVYDVMFVSLVILFFELWGVEMTGLALTAISAANLLVICTIARSKYGFRFTRRTWKPLFLQLPLVVGAILSIRISGAFSRWMLGLAVLLLSSVLSFAYLKRNTTFITTISDIIGKRFRNE